MKTCPIDSTFLWEFVDERRNRSDLRAEEFQKKSLPSLIEYGYRLALEDLCAWLSDYEDHASENIERIL